MRGLRNSVLALVAVATLSCKEDSLDYLGLHELPATIQVSVDTSRFNTQDIEIENAYAKLQSRFPQLNTPISLLDCMNLPSEVRHAADDFMRENKRSFSQAIVKVIPDYTSTPSFAYGSKTHIEDLENQRINFSSFSTFMEASGRELYTDTPREGDYGANYLVVSLTPRIAQDRYRNCLLTAAKTMDLGKDSDFTRRVNYLGPHAPTDFLTKEVVRK